jgi:hypothetical protein
MTLLLVTVPAFEDTWTECLGDLGRYRMVIEDDDVQDREVWTPVARQWYLKASDRNWKIISSFGYSSLRERSSAIVLLQ